jgi:single-stranded DNA-binding protein
MEVDWRFCTLWGGLVENAKRNHEGARGGVEGYKNCELSERLTGDVDLVSIQPE